MNKRSDNTRSLARTVLAVMAKQPEAWKTTVGTAELLARLETFVDQIDEGQHKLDTPLAPWTAERHALRTSVGNLTMTVAAQLRTHAETKGLPELVKQAEVDNRLLRYRSQTQSVSEIERILGLAAPHAAAFVPTEAGAVNRLAQLTAEAAAYREAVFGKRVREVARSDGTRSIRMSAREAARLLVKLDALMLPYEQENPTFYASYKQARKRQRLTVRSGGLDAGAAAPEPAKAA